MQPTTPAPMMITSYVSGKPVLLFQYVGSSRRAFFPHPVLGRGGEKSWFELIMPRLGLADYIINFAIASKLRSHFFPEKLFHEELNDSFGRLIEGTKLEEE